MSLPPLLRIFLSLFLGLTLVALQINASPYDRRDLSSKFRALSRREIDNEEHALVKREDVGALFKTVGANNKVPVGGTKSWSLDVKKSDLFTTAEFYGCTVVVIVNGAGVLIGHYGQETGGTEGCTVLENAAATEKNIIPGLTGELAMQDFEEGNTRAWIIHSSNKGEAAEGYVKLKAILVKYGISAGNIKAHPYSAGSGGDSFPGPNGKALVKWDAKNEDPVAATLQVFVGSDTAKFTQNYDCNGEEV